jgi:hypothetical protein
MQNAKCKMKIGAKPLLFHLVFNILHFAFSPPPNQHLFHRAPSDLIGSNTLRGKRN